MLMCRVKAEVVFKKEDKSCTKDESQLDKECACVCLRVRARKCVRVHA